MPYATNYFQRHKKCTRMCLPATEIDLFLWLLLFSNFLAKRTCNQEDACLRLHGLIFHLLPRYLLLWPRDTLSITNLEQLQDRSPWHWTFPYHVLAKGKRQETSLSIKFDSTYLHESHPTIPSSVVPETINCAWSLISPRDERAPPACHACACILPALFSLTEIKDY